MMFESLLRRLQAITTVKGKLIKYEPKELYTQWAYFRAKILSTKKYFNLNIHIGSFYLALIVYSKI
jgi:hypothetical protein